MRKRTVAERLNIGDNASPGTEVEVVWATDEKRGALRRKEGDGNESTRKV